MRAVDLSQNQQTADYQDFSVYTLDILACTR